MRNRHRDTWGLSRRRSNSYPRLLLAILLGPLVGIPVRAVEIPIVAPPTASPLEKTVAAELAERLHSLYPGEEFPVAEQLPTEGKAILLGTVADPLVRKLAAPAELTDCESFVVTTVADGPRRIGVIAGADPRGAAYGAYRLLEKLGCGFHLSTDTLPAPRKDAFSFDGWALADKPLVRERIVFDWHNFLSGCSTWNLRDWRRWTEQSQKMGHNAIMVHAYGNNPMVQFVFNGRTKPVGYLSTTARGRDWSTMHVDDVRRMWGGSVFDAPVFGADAALVPDDQRATAAQELMRGVFAHAGQRGMDVFFANDVDTVSANPQDLILTLPEEARFPIQAQALSWMGQEAGRLWLANPDTAEGYRYYKAQAEALLTAYPQITCLVVWFRRGGTPWMEFKVAEMPARWQEEYQAELAKTPDAAKLWHAHNIFALGKVAAGPGGRGSAEGRVGEAPFLCRLVTRRSRRLSRRFPRHRGAVLGLLSSLAARSFAKIKRIREALRRVRVA